MFRSDGQITLRIGYNPIEVAECAVAQKIHREPAFHWWVTKVLKKRDRLIHKVVSRCRKGNKKFGIAVPRTVAEDHELDRINGNTFRADAIKKEMDNVKITFNVLECLQVLRRSLVI